MLITLLKMMRLKNIAIAMLTLYIGYLLMGDTFGHYTGIFTIILELLGFAFAIGFANIQNDILDYETDKLNRPERPLVSGAISMKAAGRAWKVLAALTILCGVGISVTQHIRYTPGHISFDSAFAYGIHFAIPTILFTLLALLLTAYNRFLKRIPLLKNMTVAFLCTTPLLFALADMLLFSTRACPDEYLWKVVPAIPFAFLLTTAREIYKDLEDETGDLKAGIMTFPLIAGAATARRFAGALILFTWILLPLPTMLQFYPTAFLVASAVALTPSFAYILIQACRKNYRKSQSFVKVAMFVGLMALLFTAY